MSYQDTKESRVKNFAEADRALPRLEIYQKGYDEGYLDAEQKANYDAACNSIARTACSTPYDPYQLLNFISSPAVLESIRQQGMSVNWAEVLKVITDKPVLLKIT